MTTNKNQTLAAWYAARHGAAAAELVRRGAPEMSATEVAAAASEPRVQVEAEMEVRVNPALQSFSSRAEAAAARLREAVAIMAALPGDLAQASRDGVPGEVRASAARETWGGLHAALKEGARIAADGDRALEEGRALSAEWAGKVGGDLPPAFSLMAERALGQAFELAEARATGRAQWDAARERVDALRAVWAERRERSGKEAAASAQAAADRAAHAAAQKAPTMSGPKAAERARKASLSTRDAAQREAMKGPGKGR